jgi:electron transfer flavoprotein alpha/beta subunit
VTVAVLLRRLQGRPGANADGEAIGRCERGALTAALALGAALGEPAIAIAVGPARREDRVLAMALRGGAGRAVRVSDDGLDDLDYLGLASVLAAAATWAGATIVLCGDRSEEEGTGAVGPAVAELMGAAHLTGVASVTRDGASAADPVLLVERVAGGARERFRIAPPAVLCMRPPGLRARGVEAAAAPALANDETQTTRASVRAPTSIEELDLARLGLDPRALGYRRGTAGRLRPVRGPRRALVASSPADLVRRLRADHLVPPTRPDEDAT